MIKEVQYRKALDECFKIHLDRYKKYGDSWKTREEYQLMGLVKEKADRLEYNFLNPNDDYENKKDCLIDLINWSLFYLENLTNKKYDKLRPNNG